MMISHFFNFDCLYVLTGNTTLEAEKTCNFADIYFGSGI